MPVIIVITPANNVVGGWYTCFPMAVCLSVEKWCLRDKFISLWHTIMILHKCVEPLLILKLKGRTLHLFRTITLVSFDIQWCYFILANYWRRTPIDFWVKMLKVKVKFCACTLHHFCTWCMITLLYFDPQWWYITYNYVAHDPRWTTIDFGVQRLKMKVKFCAWTFHLFCRITLLSFDIWKWCLTLVLPMTLGGSPLILVKSSKVISN